MQEMTNIICYRANMGEEGKLEDIRDGKIYWVAKLKDNNCWMTQNLDLDITASGLSASDSDIETDWNVNSTNKPVATQTGNDFSFAGANTIASWDPADGGTPTYCPSGKCSTTSTTSSNNGHDAQGNYYSYAAATAGTAPSTSGTASGSICPKGWQLPLSGSNNDTVNGSFYNLVNGLTVAQIIAAPYYFVEGGSLVKHDYLYDAGYYWSSTATDSTYAYNLKFDTSVRPSNNDYRYIGYSVRCVAK